MNYLVCWLLFCSDFLHEEIHGIYIVPFKNAQEMVS